MNRPVLALFTYGRETEVHTDANVLGTARMILERQEDGKLHPVAYYSRQTSDSESRYHSYELKLLVMVETVTKYSGYLLRT